ncbi:hypothetical protein AB0D34_46205 [Streptomyces sp. NPDC048420]
MGIRLSDDSRRTGQERDLVATGSREQVTAFVMAEAETIESTA